MKGRQAADLRNLPVDELKRTLTDIEETLMNMRFQRAIGELEDTAQIRITRKDIARIKTILTEKEHSESRSA